MYDTAARIALEPPTTTLNGIPSSGIRQELDLVLRSRAFIQSHRIRRFLQFIVEESLLGQPHRLKEYVIGLEVFDRREAFDPRVDSIVRVEARRLRNKLEEYYRGEGREDQVRIVLRKGSYVPMFEYRSAAGGFIPAQRRIIEIAAFSFVNPVPGATALADEIQRRLAHVLIKEGSFHVIARPQAEQVQLETNQEEPNGEGAALHSSKAGYVVEGGLEFHPDGFHLIVQLFQTADESYVWSEATDGQFGDLWCVEQLAKLLVRELLASPNEGMVDRRHAAQKESRDFYLQGRYYWKLATPDSIRDSVSCFVRAVECDENYAAAWAALAEALLVSSVFGFLASNEAGNRMKEAAEKAVSLNALLPEAHVALGALSSILDWDWAAGQQELEKAIQLDCHDPIGHIAYGIQLACRGMLDAAIVEVERALELDPAALFPNFLLGWLYGVSRRFDEAISQHLLVSQFAPDYGLPQFGLGLAYAGKGMFQDAIAHFTNASQMKCHTLLRGHLGYCYAMAGRRDEALRELGSLSIRSDSSYVSPVSLAAINAGLGENEQALRYLELAVDERDASLPVHLLNPEFDKLRDEPRFQALRLKIGLT